jgi:anti-sigma regulatory factor (Ser/Thr protein kinase)
MAPGNLRATGIRRSGTLPGMTEEARRSRCRLRADSTAAGAARDVVERFSQQWRIAGGDVARVLIVVEELVTNIAKYGYTGEPGHIELRLRLAGGRLTILLIDDGAAFDPFAAAPPDLEAPIEARRVGGLGLPIVKAWMDRTRYRRAGRYNVVTVSRPVEGA